MTFSSFMAIYLRAATKVKFAKMRIVMGIQVVLGIYIFYESSQLGRGQYNEDPKKHFKYITFDLLHRGSFNDTPCTRELLNCWEVIKPDIICFNYTVHESVCGVVHLTCHENHGWENSDFLGLYEAFCESKY